MVIVAKRPGTAAFFVQQCTHSPGGASVQESSALPALLHQFTCMTPRDIRHKSNLVNYHENISKTIVPALQGADLQTARISSLMFLPVSFAFLKPFFTDVFKKLTDCHFSSPRGVENGTLIEIICRWFKYSSLKIRMVSLFPKR